MSPQACWRCEHPTTKDVKYVDRPANVVKIEARGYVCVLDPDYEYDVIDNIDEDEE